MRSMENGRRTMITMMMLGLELARYYGLSRSLVPIGLPDNVFARSKQIWFMLFF